MNDLLFGKDLFIPFTVHSFSESLSVCVYASFPFGVVGGMRDLTVSVPDQCLSFYFDTKFCCFLFILLNFMAAV